MLFLIVLIFLSKISFKIIPGVPYEISPLIFQYGLHPYINIGIVTLFGGFFILKKILAFNGHSEQSRFFRFYIVTTCLFLLFVTFLQVMFVETSFSLLMQFGSVTLSIITIYLFGRVVPINMSSIDFLKVING